MATPIPSTKLFVESLLLSSKQQLVLDVIHQFPEGARIPDITQALGIHVNTARGHINELEEKGAIIRIKVDPTGPGRPYIAYKPRVPDNRMVVEEYITLINALCSQLVNLSDQPDDMAKLVGEQWGKQLLDLSPITGENLTAVIVEKFRMLGFDPKLEGSTIKLGSCPFVTTEQNFNPLICAIHKGMLTAMGKPLQLQLSLTPKVEQHSCRVDIEKSTEL